MNFADLYRYANRLDAGVIRVTGLTNFVTERYALVGKIDYWGVDLDDSVSLGHMVLEQDRTSPYEEEYVDASIRYSRKLNRCWRRLVCCKELMHVLDGRTERVNTYERFVQLMLELETKPLTSDISKMYQSERDAMWMAFLVLCPQSLRDEYSVDYVDDDSGNRFIADKLKIPVQAVRAVMSEYYFTALERLTGERLARARTKPGE